MFRHPATVAVDDLVYLAVSVSDSSAADALLELTSPAEVTAVLTGLGIRGIEVRHGLGTLSETPAEALAPDVRALAYAVATKAGGPRGGSLSTGTGSHPSS